MRDVLVVGGGLIGTAIAWRAAQKRARVTLVDAGNLGGEASPAGAGMLSPESESIGDLGVESLKMYPAFVEELRAETNFSIDFRVCGCQVIGGEFYANDALVDPADLLRALRCACELHHVQVIRQRMDSVNATHYDAVVIAAGAWSSRIKIGHALPEVIPVKGHLVGFQLKPGLLGPYLRREHFYVLQRSSGFLIAGSNEEQSGFDTGINEVVCEEIQCGAAELLPVLAGREPDRKWIGFRPYSPGGPHIGRLSDTNIWLAYGHHRNGILLTPLTAAKIAAELS